MTTPTLEATPAAERRRPGGWSRPAGNAAVAVAVVGLTAFGVISHTSGHPRLATNQAGSAPTQGAQRATPSAVVPTATVPAAPHRRPAASPTCPSALQRGRSALRLLRRPDLLGGVTVVFAGGRTGVLASTDVGTRTVTAYVRGCDVEPLAEIAAAVVDQAVQLKVSTSWTSAQQQQWLALRGVEAQWSVGAQQDVGAVAVEWELGTTRWWHSSLPAPATVGPQLAAALTG